MSPILQLSHNNSQDDDDDAQITSFFAADYEDVFFPHTLLARLAILLQSEQHERETTYYCAGVKNRRGPGTKVISLAGYDMVFTSSCCCSTSRFI
jgi:hypothetical protein